MMLLRAAAWTLILGLVACGDGGGFPDAKLPDAAPPGGTMSAMWSIVDQDNQPLTCAEIGGQAVTLILHNVEQAGAQTEVFGCTSAAGTTPVVPPGTYEVAFELQHGTYGLIGQAPPQMNIVVESNQNTPLTPVVFQVNATGGLDLKVTANKTGGNCAPVGMMGAGIQNMTISLTSPGNVCEPVTFTISSTPERMYTVNCANPVVTPCIEASESIKVASGVPTGRYTFSVTGLVNGTDCYRSNDALTVPPAGNVFARTFNLAPTGAMGCP